MRCELVLMKSSRARRRAAEETPGFEMVFGLAEGFSESGRGAEKLGDRMKFNHEVQTTSCFSTHLASGSRCCNFGATEAAEFDDSEPREKTVF